MTSLEAAAFHPLEAVLHRDNKLEIHRPEHDQAVPRRTHRLLLRHAGLLHHVARPCSAAGNFGVGRLTHPMRCGLSMAAAVVIDCSHMSHDHDWVLEEEAKWNWDQVRRVTSKYGYSETGAERVQRGRLSLVHHWTRWEEVQWEGTNALNTRRIAFVLDLFIGSGGHFPRDSIVQSYQQLHGVPAVGGRPQWNIDRHPQQMLPHAGWPLGVLWKPQVCRDLGDQLDHEGVHFQVPQLLHWHFLCSIFWWKQRHFEHFQDLDYFTEFEVGLWLLNEDQSQGNQVQHPEVLLLQKSEEPLLRTAPNWRRKRRPSGVQTDCLEPRRRDNWRQLRSRLNRVEWELPERQRHRGILLRADGSVRIHRAVCESVSFGASDRFIK